MSLYHVIVIAANFLIGIGISALGARYLPALSSDFIQVAVGVGFVLLFTWPIYRLVGLLPPPPRCPRESCRRREFEYVSGDIHSSEWQCRACGQKIVLAGSSAVILGDKGQPSGQLELRFPQFVGWWRRE